MSWHNYCNSYSELIDYKNCVPHWRIIPQSFQRYKYETTIKAFPGRNCNIMRHESSKSLFKYWDRIRAGRKAPRREEIEPSDIRQLLGDTFILDISGSMRTISYCLAGTRLCAAYGQELKGVAFLVPWEEKDCFELTSAVAKVYRDGIPQIICSIANTDSGKQVEFETLLLPLKAIDGNNHRILGLSSPGKTPFWLGAEPLTYNSVKSIRPALPPKVIGFSDASLAPELNTADTLENIRPNNDQSYGTERKVKHLTVHDGGKQ